MHRLYCPQLQCDVYDYVYRGLGVQPLIGSFRLDFGKVMGAEEESKRRLETDSERIIEVLRL